MTLGERVRQERTARGWSQAALAARISAIARRKVTQVAIHHIESRGDVSPRFVVELARALDVSLDWLQKGRGQKNPRSGPQPIGDDGEVPQVMVAHYVGAGDVVHVFDDSDAIDYHDAPPGFERGAAGIVRGESMLPMYDDGDVLFWRRLDPPPKEPPKRAVIVKIKNGPLYLKKLLPGSKKGLYHLVSINPITKTLIDQPVEAIARIGWVKPVE